MTVLVEPVCRFYRLIDSAPAPQRASRSADGTLPVRAYSYCEAVRAASAYGFYLFAPLDFGLKWDGTEIRWTYRGATEWHVLRGAAAPRFQERFERAAPAAARSLIPAFLTPLRERGVVQVWTGYLMDVSEGYSLHIRGVANMPRVQPYRVHEAYEGIVDSKIFFGPAFVNIELTRTNSPVEFTTRHPLCQVQPVLHECYRDPSFEVIEIDDLKESEWGRYIKTMQPKTDPHRKLGDYAVAARKKERGAEASPAAA